MTHHGRRVKTESEPGDRLKKRSTLTKSVDRFFRTTKALTKRKEHPQNNQETGAWAEETSVGSPGGLVRRKHSGSRGERHGKGRTSGRTESGIMMTKSGIMMTIERGNDDESGIIRTKSGMIGVSGG